jgi:DNA-binding GntR family transcriptional regulator
MILDGTLPPSSVISGSELVRQLGMSRTPVREALLRLHTEGFIRPVPHKGYQVIELGRNDLINIYEVRAVLEGLAARLAATRRTRTDLAVLADLLDEIKEAMEKQDARRIDYHNRQFHDAIARASRNDYLQSQIVNIREVFGRFRPIAQVYEHRLEEVYQEHVALNDAFIAGDADAAERLAREHLRRTLAVRLQAGSAADNNGADHSE